MTAPAERPAAPRVLALAGSLRRDSWNRKLLAVAARAAAAAGAAVETADLRDFPLPPYDGDLEATSGLPEEARRLKALFGAHDGLLVSCPEYNSSIPGTFKNVLDWISRPEPGEPPLAAYRGKLAGILSASPGQLGGIRMLPHLRHVLENLGVMVIPPQLALSRAHEAFDAAGDIADARTRASAEQVGAELARLLAALLRT